MKKFTYVTPEVEFVAISTEDVCTLSLTGDDMLWEAAKAEESAAS